MPNTAPPAHKPAPGVAGVVATPSAVSEKESAGERIIPAGLSYIERLQRTLGHIDEDKRTPSSARAVLTGYYRFLNPYQTTEHLPVSLKPHPMKPEHAAGNAGKWPVFYFHLGNAAKGMQDAYALDIAYTKGTKTGPGKEVVLSAIKVMESRIIRLETLVKAGPEQWFVMGDDREGFWLITTEEYQAWLKSQPPAPTAYDKD